MVWKGKVRKRHIQTFSYADTGLPPNNFKCDQLRCVTNKDGKCHAPRIHVSKNLKCLTFEDRGY